ADPAAYMSDAQVYAALKASPLLTAKNEKVNMGKYQQPIHHARRTLCLCAQKAYFFGIAAMSFAYKGQWKVKAPVLPEHALALAEGGPTLKQHAAAAAPWGQSCENQLDKAAVLFGDVENYYRQKLIVQVLGPTATYHS
ncbi:unnamed protein product, partial [Prorocentrum cordatum]